MTQKHSPAEIEAAWLQLVEIARIQAKHAPELAKSRRLLYRAYIDAGFTEQQALELCAKTGVNG